MVESKEDMKVYPKEEEQIEPLGLYPPEEVAGPSGVEYSTKGNYFVEVKPELKSENLDKVMDADSDEEEDDNEDDSEFDIKEEIDNGNSESEESQDESEENDAPKEIYKIEKKQSQQSNADYQRILVKSYSTAIATEEPIENVKIMFKESPLEFEKQKYHQRIFEQIVELKGKIRLKDLQAQYISQLRKLANIEIFTCSLCNYQTMNLTNLNCHLIVNHNGKTEHEIFRCSKCEYETNFMSHITRHLINNHKKSKGKGKKKEEKKEKYPCSECNYKGRSEDALKTHMSMHKNRTKCDLCSFQSQDKNALKDHKDTHKIGNYFHCYECSYKNGNKLTLALHLKKKHNLDNEMSKRSKICEICSFAAVDRYKLQQHYMSHKTVKDLTEDEIFKCPEEGCHYQTKLKAHLVAHVRIHKPPEFVCEVCGFATTRKQNYKYHLETHKKLSEIEWLPCPICPYQARSKRHLYQHMKIGAHDDKNRRHIRKRNLLAEGLPVPPPRNVKKKQNTNKDITGEGEAKKPKRKRKPKAKKQVVPNLEESFVNFEQLATAFLTRPEVS